jgi:3-deoxy-7-phosphoheptulonate synthase
VSGEAKTMKHNHNVVVHNVVDHDVVVTPILPSLDALRRQIDSIDDDLLDLIERRYAVTRQVARAKAESAHDCLPVRPTRERIIVERLSARARLVPQEDVAILWRSILALSSRSQRAYRVTLWSPEPARAALAQLAARLYGATIPVAWSDDLDSAIAAALTGESILLVPADALTPSQFPALDLIGQHPLGCLHHPWAVALGKLARDDGATTDADGWHADSWKGRVHHQQPVYRDQGALRQIEARLASATPVVEAPAIAALTAQIADAQQGRGLLLQAGDCAEPLDSTREQTLAMRALIHRLADHLGRATGR